MKDNTESAGNASRRVASLKSIDLQVGEHVVRALRQDETVAVLCAVVAGDDGNHQILSVALDADLFEDVKALLARTEVKTAPQVPCIGFHCPRPNDGQGT